MNVLVTGGASGLGRAIVLRLLEAGHFVHFTYCRSNDAARQIEAQYDHCRAYQCDFRQRDDLNSLISQINLLAPDALINNALPSHAPIQFQKCDIDDLARSFKINVLPVLRISQAALRHFRQKRSGRIITILSSYIANRPPTGYSEYVANKAYLLAMSKSWAVENAKFAISSNCISPSTLRTGLTSEVDSRLLESLAHSNPFGKLVETTEVANLVCFLVSAPQQINSTNILINGGENVV